MKVAIYLIVVAFVCFQSWNHVSARNLIWTNEEKRTTYDWGKHTGNDFDWGKYTSTYSPNEDDHNNNNNNNENNNHTNEDGNMWQHRCGAGTYTCAGAPGLCIDLTQMCDKRNDCPNGDDEETTYCQKRMSKHNSTHNDHEDEHKPNNRVVNRFRGQGFMFQIRKIKIDRSNVRLFDQDSDNRK